MTHNLDTPAHVQRRQIVVLEIDLRVYGEGDPEANEIIINGKGYGPRDLARLVGGDWGQPVWRAVERLAIAAAVKDEWEEVP